MYMDDYEIEEHAVDIVVHMVVEGTCLDGSSLPFDQEQTFPLPLNVDSIVACNAIGTSGEQAKELLADRIPESLIVRHDKGFFILTPEVPATMRITSVEKAEHQHGNSPPPWI